METRSIHIDSSTIIRFIVFAGLAVLLYELLNVVMVLLTAVVIASAIEPGVNALETTGLPRVVSVVLIYALLLLGGFVFVYFFLPPVLSDVSDLVAQAPDYIRSLQLEGSFLSESFSSADGSLSLSEIAANLQNTIAQSSQDVLSFISAVFGGVVSFILIITLSFYLAVRQGGVENFLRLVVPTRHEEYVIDLWSRTQIKIGRWLQGQLVLMLIIGVLVYLGLRILGVPNAELLAFLAALFEIIPVFGPILSAIPAIALAGISGGLSLALMTAGLFIIVQQFENNLIHPLVVTKVVGVSPIVVIIAIIVGGQLAGFLGVLLAVPLAAAVMEFAHDVDKAKHPEESEETVPAAS